MCRLKAFDRMRLIVAAFVLVLLAPGAKAGPESIESVTTRPGVSTAFIVTAPEGQPVATAILFAGGRPPQSDPCKARAQHGFFGIEQEVVAAIVRWMVETIPSSPRPR